MTQRKTHNSILVLATLGVYLGLVFVGATPQILAQAAMTRQFNVKDEIEVKDDLDTKPESTESAEIGVNGGIDTKVANSVNRFLSQFKPAAGHVSLIDQETPPFDFSSLRGSLRYAPHTIDAEPQHRLDSILTPDNLARSDLGDALASNAK